MRDESWKDRVIGPCEKCGEKYSFRNTLHVKERFTESMYSGARYRICFKCFGKTPNLEVLD